MSSLSSKKNVLTEKYDVVASPVFSKLKRTFYLPWEREYQYLEKASLDLIRNAF